MLHMRSIGRLKRLGVTLVSSIINILQCLRTENRNFTRKAAWLMYHYLLCLQELEGALEGVNKDQKKLQKLHKQLQEDFEEKKQLSENKEEVKG